MNHKPITTLVVDDEVLARVGIKSLIDWEEAGFQIVGERENGEKALEFIDRFQPELVITDIKMPKMTGLELMKKTKSRFPDTEFIILSAYDDFSYAKEAIRQGARDYLLKLEMDKTSLSHTLMRVKQIIIDNRKKRKDVNYYSPEKRLFLENQQLRDIIIKEGISEYKHPFYDRDFFVIYIHTVSARGKKLDADEKSSYQIPVLNLFREILTDHEFGLVCYLRPMEYVILYSPADLQKKEALFDLKQMTSRIRETLNNYINLNAIFSVAGPGRGEVNPLYKEARSYFQDNYIYPAGTLLPVESTGRKLPYHSIDDGNALRDILHRLKQRDIASTTLALEDFLSSTPPQSRMKRTALKSFCYEVGLGILKNLGFKDAQDYYTPFEDLDLLMTLEDYKGWINRTIIFLREKERETKKVSPLINRAASLLEKHYQEEISLSDLAENLDVSVSYLSQQFKKETGKTYTDYLTSIRTNKAAALLLETTIPIHEIALQVGYENIYYFSRVFKQKMGQSPREFRKKNIPEP